MKPYFVDYNHLLSVNLDYSEKISLGLIRDEKNVVPVVNYMGGDKYFGHNIIANLKKIMTVKQEGGDYNLYFGDECFACFQEDAENGVFLVSEVSQKYLTAFEMRMLARKGIDPKIFSRNEVSGIKHVTDLHTHFAGCLSAEDLVEIGVKHDVSIPAYLLSKIGVNIFQYEAKKNMEISLKDLSKDDMAKYIDSMQIPIERQETFNKMEDVYAMRGPLTKNKKLFPSLLRKIAQTYAQSGIKYAELSLSSVISDTEILQMIHKELPQIEKETGCKIRFLAAMWRHSDKEWNQDEVDRLKAVAKSPYIVGVDFMGHETNSTMDFGEELKEIAKWAAINDPDFVIRVHAGENPLFPNNVKDALKTVKDATIEAEAESGKILEYPGIRIGHGLYGVDDECLELCKELNAVVEFNMASNLSLNNIDDIEDVPLKKYTDEGIKFVLGSDGMGIYSTNPEQDVILAHAVGVSKERLIQMIAFEEELIVSKEERFIEKNNIFNHLLDSGVGFEEIIKPQYGTTDGRTHYNNDVEQRKKEEIEKLQAFLSSEISRIGAETNPDKVAAIMSDKLPVLITGASVKAWPNISKEQQDEIRTSMQVLVNVLDPEKAYIMTGGTNHGVERQVHELAHNRNLKSSSQLAIIGTLTEEAAYQDIATIEKNTITHAVVLSLNGKIAKRWFDLPDTVLDVVEKQKGEIIAVGGGGVVRDMIQRAHNMRLGINLMDGPEGASTEKSAIMPEYAFQGAKGLIEKLYRKHPNIFRNDFDICRLDEYVEQARSEQRKILEVSSVQTGNLLKTLKANSKKSTNPNMLSIINTNDGI